MVSSTAQLLHAWQAFELCVPTLHAAALYLTLPSNSRQWIGQAFIWPLAGGSRCFVFQLLSWIMFAVSLLLALPVWLHQRALTRFSSLPPHQQLELLSLVATFSAAMSLLFMLKSVLVFDPAGSEMRQTPFWARFSQGRSNIEWDVSRLPNKLLASYIVMGLGVVWAALGAALLLASQHMRGQAIRVAYCCFAGACFTIAAFTTHGLGGYLRFKHRQQEGSKQSHTRGSSPEIRPARVQQGTGSTAVAIAHDDEGHPHASSWQFFQPFQGGGAFIMVQALGWMLYSSALALIVWGMAEAALGVAHCLHSWTLAAGTSAVVAELMLAASLLTYQVSWVPCRGAALSALSHAAVVVALYLPAHVVVASFILTFAALPAVHAAALWAGGLGIYFSVTGVAEAEHTGRREWATFRKWLGSEAERCLPAWLGSFEVRLDPGAKFEPGSKRYVFGYVAHGLYPLGAAYLPSTPSFQRLLPGVHTVTLIASVVFQLPLLRDLLTWAGCRVVGRETFRRALRDCGAVVLVPGGQAELVEAHRMFPRHRRGTSRRDPEFAVYTRHKGFVRLAIQEGAFLVPLVALGEVSSFRNVVSLPAMQRWSYKVLGFPLPFLIGGRLGFLPLPARTGLRFVIGTPIEPPALAPGEAPSEQDVDALHAAFYSQVERLFVQHKEGFPGYENVRLRLGV